MVVESAPKIENEQKSYMQFYFLKNEISYFLKIHISFFLLLIQDDTYQYVNNLTSWLIADLLKETILID